MTTMRVVGECFFWYRLTRVFPDKFHRAVKRLCVCVCVVDTITALLLLNCDWKTSAISQMCTALHVYDASQVQGYPASPMMHAGWNGYLQAVTVRLVSKNGCLQRVYCKMNWLYFYFHKYMKLCRFWQSKFFLELEFIVVIILACSTRHVVLGFCAFDPAHHEQCAARCAVCLLSVPLL